MALLTKAITETIGIAEARTRRVQRFVDQTFFFDEVPQYPRYHYEPVGIGEAQETTVAYDRTLTPQEYTYSEEYTRYLHKALVYSFDTADAFGKRLHKNISEAVAVRDTLLRNSNCVIYDIVLRSDSLSYDDINAIADSPPIGYTPFQTFYPGDYEFREAMVGVRVRSFDTTARAGILGLTHNVDVPDVTDRGTAIVASGETAGKTVSFTKVFAIPPEVYVVFSEGTTAALPEITGVTNSDFTFILRDISSPSTLVEGTVTWAALGR